MPPRNFIALILTHGRADRVVTYNVLRNQGYTGPICLIVDNEDSQLEEYKQRYNESEIYVIDKREIAKQIDEGDNAQDRRTILHARCESFNVAKKLGYQYFIQLDDDYTRFSYRFSENRYYCHKAINNLDRVFSSLLKFYKNTSFVSIAMSQGGDFMGGPKGTSPYMKTIGTRRKAMNTFICDTERQFQFRGRFNEDVNTYTSLQRAGVYNFLTILGVSVNQGETQSNAGGITEMYKENGTYVKSFYTVMYTPSATKIGKLGNVNPRLHHRIKWDSVAPLILSEQHRKTPKTETA